MPNTSSLKANHDTSLMVSPDYLDLKQNVQVLQEQLNDFKAIIVIIQQELADTKQELTAAYKIIAKQAKTIAIQTDKIQSLNTQLKKALGISSNRDTPTGGADDGGDNNDHKKDSAAESLDFAENTSEHLKSLGKDLKILSNRELSGFRSFLKGEGLELREWISSSTPERALIPVCETTKGMKIMEVHEDQKKFQVGDTRRMESFGKIRGFSTSKDHTKRYGIELRVTEYTNEIERITDPETGRSLRADDLDWGPPNYQITWDSLKVICCLVLEHGIPMERLEDIIKIPYFSSSNIARWVQLTAEWFLDSYFAIFRRLHKYRYLKMDDTSVLVLGMQKDAASDDFTERHFDITAEQEEENLKQLTLLAAKVASEMGRVSDRKDNKGVKKSINLTLVIGQLYGESEKDYDSKDTLYLYRTHFGQAGNLLSRVLEESKGSLLKVENVFIQSDRSSQNLLENSMKDRVKIIEVGCYAHARRPFVNELAKDTKLCNYMLVQFLRIAHHEKMAFIGALSSEKILRARDEERQYWLKIKDVCEHVVSGKIHPIAENKPWHKNTALFNACQYILKHYKALTVYLDNPYLKAENNHTERSLRVEKKIQDSSKFRQSEEGRVAFDVIRSVMACCQAAEVDFAAYMKYCYERSCGENDNSAVLLPNEFREYLAKKG
jgi:hypothetical protein